VPAIGATRVGFFERREWASEMDELRRKAACLPVIVCVGAVPFLLAGCGSNTFALDDGVPNTAPAATIVTDAPPPPTTPFTKRDSGTYPTFGRTLTAANTQIGDEEAAGSEAQLTALAKARANGSVSEAEYQSRLAELRRLAAEHGRDAEAAIAN
jgi:hypothetical protein